MHKGFKLAALAGALSVAMSGSVLAANHDLSFTGWDVTGGQINEFPAATAPIHRCRAGS